MSNGPIHKSDMDGLLSASLRAVELGTSPIGVTVTAPLYPTLDIPDLLASVEKLKADKAKAESEMLDALVDIVNRSPWGVMDWAATLNIPFVQFIATCHREQPPNSYFWEKVTQFFEPWRGKPNPSWEELAPLIKHPDPLTRR